MLCHSSVETGDNNILPVTSFQGLGSWPVPLKEPRRAPDPRPGVATLASCPREHPDAPAELSSTSVTRRGLGFAPGMTSVSAKRHPYAKCFKFPQGKFVYKLQMALRASATQPFSPRCSPRHRQGNCLECVVSLQVMGRQREGAGWGM